ncbi:sensor histidine kinase [Actinacidiphila acididurans]|uniref:histidine kinase n=1 Tax=Actinacidiphila acididurans TaxID=2784346 RepID=A0ABS2TXR8_9ACTN|nr:ATP-binding protein [Actinacidiphila acididurans]MBM9508135.1 HAMP domain-containing protein [Actinacidiphila acididurans]
MSVDEVDGPARPRPVPPGRGGEQAFADRWPFRRKLNVLVGVPLVVVGLLLAYVISGLVGQARTAGSAARLVRDSRQVAELVDRVQTEHQQALLLSVHYEAATDGRRPSLAPYLAARQAVDTQVDKVRDTFGSRLPDAEAQILKEINGWGSLRSTVEQSYLPADNIDPAYISAVDGLIDGLDLVRTMGDTRTATLLDSLLRAEAAHSSFETAVFSAQTGDANALIEFVNAVGDDRLYTDQAARFGRFATEAQSEELAGIEQTPVWNSLALQYAGLQIDPSALGSGTPHQVQMELDKALRSYPDYQTQAQHRLKLTGDLIDQIATRADNASNRAWWRAALLLAVAVLAFIGWLALSVAVRRSVVRPVHVLTGAATEVADVAGQELARVADDDADDAGPLRLRNVPVSARDEIGDLAQAFNRVQSTAAALLERQVLSRRNVAEMFGNVGRRISNLTARQLALIDAVEHEETDPDRLDRLYRIDHLAVRLQRNADSLMLLAGIRETGLDGGPTALSNVVRAALGQIEGYQRVSLRADGDVTVAPDIIADLTLMLAELLENAVAFSPARSPVEVTLRTGPDGALIEIRDHGLGMSAERLAEENARLIRRERLDLVPTKVLGLFVVGSLARRWGVRVTLSRTTGGGVTARVTIPSALLLLMSPFAEAGSAYDNFGPGTRNADTRAALVTAPPAGADPDRDPGTPAELPALPRRNTAPATAGQDGQDPAQERPEGEDGGEDGTQEHRRPESGALPQRVPQRQRPDTPEPPAGAAPAAPHRAEPEPLPPHRTSARDTAASTPHPAQAGPDGDGPRPLRRRVRGATLHTTVGEGAAREGREAPRTVDAEAVRSELDEFEAAVERAHRDSAADSADGTTQHEAGLPEGAQQ